MPASVLLAAALVAAVMVAYRLGTRPERGPDPEHGRMRTLISRLAKAESHEIRIAGELVVGHTERDETVRSDILAEGDKAIPYLIEGLSHRDAYVRLECAYMLVRMPRKVGVEALIACLEGKVAPAPPSWAVHRALHRLTGHGPYLPPQPRELMALWESWWEANRSRLVDVEEGLGLRQDGDAVIALPIKESVPAEPYDGLPASVAGSVRELRESHPAMRAAAAQELGERGVRAAVPFLVESLKDKQWLVRREAAAALGRIGDASAVPALEDALHDNEALVRAAAAEALQEIRARGQGESDERLEP